MQSCDGPNEQRRQMSGNVVIRSPESGAVPSAIIYIGVIFALACALFKDCGIDLYNITTVA